jgi:hypothetical protein
MRPMQQTSCWRGTPTASKGAIPGEDEGILVARLLDDDESFVIVDDWELSLLFSLLPESALSGDNDSWAPDSIALSSSS